MLDETGFVERLRFFDGMSLFAADIQAIETFNREMRWTHNRSLHRPGIGKGFAVSGAKGSRQVTVGPGYGLDAEGKETVSIREVTLEVPPVAGESEGVPAYYDLVVSYPDDSLLTRAEMRQGVCCPPGAVRLREEPVFCWVRLRENTQAAAVRRVKTPGPVKLEGVLQAEDPKLRQEILEGIRIVLARIEVLDCQLNRDVSLAERRSARPSCRPHVTCGVQAGDWEIVRKPLYPYLFEITTRVDTTPAHFRTIPFYEGHIEGNRPLELKNSAGDRFGYIFDLGMGVRNEQIDSFEAVAVVVFAPSAILDTQGIAPAAGGAFRFGSLAGVARGIDVKEDGSELDASLRKNSAGPLDAWSVTWMGVEA